VRLDGIDILRGIAVSAVIVYHFFVILGKTAHPLYPYVEAFGHIGVPLFFVISGYLIFRSIERAVTNRGVQKGIIHFAIHRIFRITPAYYFNLLMIYLMAGLVLYPNFYNSADFMRQFLSHLTFTSYFTHKSAGFGFNGAYWTLDVEMLWYVVAPLLFFRIKKLRGFIGLFVLSWTYSWLVAYGYCNDLLGITSPTLIAYWLSMLPGQIDLFIAGILIYRYKLFYRFPAQTMHYIAVVMLLILYIIIVGMHRIPLGLVGLHMVTLVTVSLLFILLYPLKIGSWFGGLLEWIGKISYSLYLWHMPILYVMQKSQMTLHRPPLEVVTIFTVLLLSIASMSYYFIEEGGFALRDRVLVKLFGKTR
jgi:peptidoglycan/LPS O-acetylase OafA/YrhL